MNGFFFFLSLPPCAFFFFLPSGYSGGPRALIRPAGFTFLVCQSAYEKSLLFARRRAAFPPNARSTAFLSDRVFFRMMRFAAAPLFLTCRFRPDRSTFLHQVVRCWRQIHVGLLGTGMSFSRHIVEAS